MADLSIRENNLYYNGFLLSYPDDGEMELLRDKLVIEPQEEDKWHTIRYDDRLDILAWKFYGELVPDSSKYWWVIADANNIYNPLDLSEWVGKNVFIPNIFRIKLQL